VTGRRVLIGLFVLMLPLVTPRMRASDEIESFAYVRSIVFDRDLEFGNEYRYFYERDPQALAGFKATFLDRTEERTGRHINFAPIGSSLLWAPFYLFAHAGVGLARALGAAVPADGYSTPYAAAASYASALYAFLGLLLVHDALRRFAGATDLVATAVTAALWWGTPLLYYMTLAPGFGHANSVLTVGLLIWLSLRAHERASWSPLESAAIGAVGGLAALVREQDLLFLAVPGILVLKHAWRTGRFAPAVLAAAAMGTAAFLAYVPQLVAYHATNGGFLPSKHVQNKMSFASPHFFQVLVDPGHGLFVWTPLLLLALLGLGALVARGRTEWAPALLVAFVLQVWISGSVESWTQAGAFGARRFVATTPVLAFGLAFVAGGLASRAGRLSLAAATLLFVWWNVSLMIQFGLKLMDRQGLEWPRVARNQVVEVPRQLTHVAWLMLTDRERLVQESR
jgi:hypothetical protein